MHTTAAPAPQLTCRRYAPMEHADTAQLAAVGGALGSVLVAAGTRAAAAARRPGAPRARPRWALAWALGGRSARQAERRHGRRRGGRWRSRCSPPPPRCSCGGRGSCPIAVLVAAPFRPPLDFDSSRALARVDRRRRAPRPAPAALLRARGRGGGARRGARCAAGEVRALPRAIALPAAAFFAFACCSLLWAEDLEAGANLLAVLHAAVRGAARHGGARRRTRDWAPRGLATAALALAAAVRGGRASGRRPRTSCSSTRPTSPCRTRTRTTSA